MGSESKEVRIAQLAKVAAQVEEWKSDLARRGIEGKVAERNPTMRGLMADLRRAKRRISAMEAAEAHVRSVVEKGDEVKIKADKAAPKKGKGKQAQPAAKPAKPAKPAKKK